MKKFLILFLLSSQVFAQDDSKCLIELKTFGNESSRENNVALSKNPQFMKMLQEKGYLPTFTELSRTDDWSKVSYGTKPDDDLLKKLDNKILLTLKGLSCSEIPAKSWGITIGSWSKSTPPSSTWGCYPGYNKFYIQAISNSVTYTSDFKNLGDSKKTFPTLAAGEAFLIQEFSKNLPSCQELRKKMPEVGKVKVQAIVKDLKEIESAAKDLTPAQDGDISIKNDNNAKVIVDDQKQQDSKSATDIRK